MIPPTLFIFKIDLAIPGPFRFHKSFKKQCFYEKITAVLNGIDCTESTDQLRENWHINNIVF